jgi:hypothetical protein
MPYFILLIVFPVVVTWTFSQHLSCDAPANLSWATKTSIATPTTAAINESLIPVLVCYLISPQCCISRCFPPSQPLLLIDSSSLEESTTARCHLYLCRSRWCRHIMICCNPATSQLPIHVLHCGTTRQTFTPLVEDAVGTRRGFPVKLVPQPKLPQSEDDGAKEGQHA